MLHPNLLTVFQHIWPACPEPFLQHPWVARGLRQPLVPVDSFVEVCHLRTSGLSGPPHQPVAVEMAPLLRQEDDLLQRRRAVKEAAVLLVASCHGLQHQSPDGIFSHTQDASRWLPQRPWSFALSAYTVHKLLVARMMLVLRGRIRRVMWAFRKSLLLAKVLSLAKEHEKKKNDNYFCCEKFKSSRNGWKDIAKTEIDTKFVDNSNGNWYHNTSERIKMKEMCI